MFKKKKNSKTFEVGNFNKRKINFYYGCWDKPWIIAKFFSSNDTIQQTSFIEKLTIMSSSYKNGASFNLRILEANLDGSPSNDLLDQNIVVKVQKGKHNNEIDLRQFNIRFPKNGIFISVEFLIIEANKYDVEVSFPEVEKKIMSSYQPSIGTVPADFSTTWRYSVGRWKKFETKNKNEEPKAYFDKYSELAIKLTLSN